MSVGAIILSAGDIFALVVARRSATSGPITNRAILYSGKDKEMAIDSSEWRDLASSHRTSLALQEAIASA